MRKSGKIRFTTKSTGVFLLLSGIALYVAPPAMAADACAAPCNTKAKTCAECDKIFSNAGSKLTDELARLSKECCAPKCDDTCAKPADCCATSGGCDSCCDDGGLLGDCCLGDPWELYPTNCDGIKVGGWMQFGYHSENTGLFNNLGKGLNLHQGYLYIEKVADGSCDLDWGFRIDGVYGVDGTDTQAFGNPAGEWDFMNGFDHGIYSWALPQAYVEVAEGDWSIIAGHFYTIAGYEVVTAPGNFFYSHAMTMFRSEPFTHTGALATQQVSDTVKVYGGWTLGWDTGFDRLNNASPFNNGNNFLGGASVDVTDDVNFTYTTTVGDLGSRGSGYSHSIVIDTSLADDWNWVVLSDMVDTNQGAGGHEYGLTNYLFHTINDCWSVGTRVEWWKSNAFGPGMQSEHSWTFGVNYKPHANVVIRPELRHDWNRNPAGQASAFGAGRGNGKTDYTSVGMDVIFLF